MVHAEIVLKGDGGECLGGSLYLHSLFGLDGLMQSVGIAAAFHDTACLFVNDLDLVIVDHIFHILLEKRICLEQLGDGVYAFRFDGIVLHQFVFLLATFCKILDGLGLG